MFQSIIIYGFMALSFYLLGFKYIEYNNNTAINKKQPFFSVNLLLIILIFCFFSGVRYDVGSDYLSYLTDYLRISNGQEINRWIERGWINFMTILSFLDCHFSVFFGIVAFVQIFGLYYCAKNDAYIYPFLGLLIILSFFSFNMWNGIRQYFVIGIFLCIFQLIDKPWKYLPIFLIAVYLLSTIHLSASFLVVLYLFFKIKRNLTPSIFIQIVIIVVAVILGSNNIGEIFFSKIDMIVSFSGYEKKYSGINLENIERETSWGIRGYMLFSINLICVLYSQKMRKAFADSSRFTRYYNAFFVATVAGLIFKNFIFGTRIIEYLAPFSLFVYAFLLYFLFKKGKNKLSFFIGCLVCMLFALFTLISIYVDTLPGHHHNVVWHFFWENTINNY